MYIEIIDLNEIKCTYIKIIKLNEIKCTHINIIQLNEIKSLRSMKENVCILKLSSMKKKI